MTDIKPINPIESLTNAIENNIESVKIINDSISKIVKNMNALHNRVITLERQVKNLQQAIKPKGVE